MAVLQPVPPCLPFSRITKGIFVPASQLTPFVLVMITINTHRPGLIDTPGAVHEIYTLRCIRQSREAPSHGERRQLISRVTLSTPTTSSSSPWLSLPTNLPPGCRRPAHPLSSPPTYLWALGIIPIHHPITQPQSALHRTRPWRFALHLFLSPRKNMMHTVPRPRGCSRRGVNVIDNTFHLRGYHTDEHPLTPGISTEHGQHSVTSPHASSWCHLWPIARHHILSAAK